MMQLHEQIMIYTKICAMICLHNSSEIIAWMQYLFVYIFPEPTFSNTDFFTA